MLMSPQRFTVHEVPQILIDSRFFFYIKMFDFWSINANFIIICWVIWREAPLNWKKKLLKFFGLCERNIEVLNLCKVNQQTELMKLLYSIWVIRLPGLLCNEFFQSTFMYYFQKQLQKPTLLLFLWIATPTIRVNRTTWTWYKLITLCMPMPIAKMYGFGGWIAVWSIFRFRYLVPSARS